MALTHQRVTVSTSAVALNTASPSGMRLKVQNVSGAANGADLGASTVTAGTGFSLPQNAVADFELQPGEVLFAIRSGAADATLAVVRSGA